MWIGLFALVMVVPAGACGGDSGGGARTALPTASGTFPIRSMTVESGGTKAKLSVEVASTPREREQGLMYRQALDDAHGMLFVYPREEAGGHWMKNTYIALDIAYAAADGTVQEVRKGNPLDETVLRPAQAYRYVLEVPAGWFERKGLGVGAKLALPADLPAAE